MNKSLHYLGYVGRSSGAGQSIKDALRAEEDCNRWSHTAPVVGESVVRAGKRCVIIEEDGCMILLRGYAIVDSSQMSRLNLKQALHEMFDSYRHSGTFEPQYYVGSFTVLLLDAKHERIKIFRNMVGNTFTYYRQSKEGLIFGSNLAEVVRLGTSRTQVDMEMLPVYFIYRFVPGGNTLFEGVKRLQPGEMLTYENGRLSVQQVQTFATFEELNKTNEEESIERLEAVMAQVTRDHMVMAPKAACLLSGGVDSSYIQAHWNRTWKELGNEAKPKSAAVWLDSPKTVSDHEYTLSAVAEMKTEHLDVEIDNLSAKQMRMILSQTGEMPNHVQSFYFGSLAEAMAAKGISAGLCGEGADGLFGSDAQTVLRSARQLKGRFPFGSVRGALAIVARLFGKDYSANALDLSRHYADTTWPRHPVNMVVAFTDVESIYRSFGRDAYVSAQEYRRQLLTQYLVPRDVLHLQWASMAAFLTESIGTAAYWNQLFSLHGVHMLHPFMDTRMLRVASNIRLDNRFISSNPKQILKRALALHIPENFVSRPKRAFGQPIFEWLGESGSLRRAVNEIAHYDFVDQRSLERARKKPNWFLYNLLVYDLWHKEFID
jgi:asparagine synthase (glutamine-hydrolysing)